MGFGGPRDSHVEPGVGAQQGWALDNSPAPHTRSTRRASPPRVAASWTSAPGLMTSLIARPVPLRQNHAATSTTPLRCVKYPSSTVMARANVPYCVDMAKAGKIDRDRISPAWIHRGAGWTATPPPHVVSLVNTAGLLDDPPKPTSLHQHAAKQLVPSHPGWSPHSTVAPTHPLSENSRCGRCGAPCPLFGDVCCDQCGHPGPRGSPPRQRPPWKPAGAVGTWPSSPGTRNAASPPSLRPPSRSSWTVGGAEDTDTFTAVQQQHPTVPASYTWQPQQPQQQGSSSDTTTAVTGTSAFTTDTDVLSDVTSVPTALRAPPLTYTEAPPSCGEEYPTGMPPPPPPEVLAPPPPAAVARPPPASASAAAPAPSARPQRRSVSAERRPRWNQRTPTVVSSSSLHSKLSTRTSSRAHSASPQRRRTLSKASTAQRSSSTVAAARVSVQAAAVSVQAARAATAAAPSAAASSSMDSVVELTEGESDSDDSLLLDGSTPEGGWEQHRASLDSLAQLERLIEAQHLQLVERGIIPRDVDEDIFSESTGSLLRTHTDSHTATHTHTHTSSASPHSAQLSTREEASAASAGEGGGLTASTLAAAAAARNAAAFPTHTQTFSHTLDAPFLQLANLALHDDAVPAAAAAAAAAAATSSSTSSVRSIESPWLQSPAPHQPRQGMKDPAPAMAAASRELDMALAGLAQFVTLGAAKPVPAVGSATQAAVNTLQASPPPDAPSGVPPPSHAEPSVQAASTMQVPKLDTAVEDVLKWQRTERHDESTTTTTDGASTVAAAARALEAAVASAADGDDGTAAAVPMPRASAAPPTTSSSDSETGGTEAAPKDKVAMKERRRCLQFSGSDSAPHPASVLDAASSAWSQPTAPSSSTTSMSAEEEEVAAAVDDCDTAAAATTATAASPTSSASSSSLGDVC